MQHCHPQPHLAAAVSATVSGGSTLSSDLKRGKKRGSYNCGRCGLPKKGHNCNVETTTSAASSAAALADSSPSTFSAISAPTSVSAIRQPPSRQPFPHLRRALSFDDFDDYAGGIDPSETDHRDGGDPLPERESGLDSCGLPVGLLWDVLRRLPPAGLLSAAQVCQGWRNTVRRLWRAAEELKLRVPASVQVGFVASMLQKCPGITRLNLRMERCGICSIHWTISDPQSYIAIWL